MSNEFVHGSVGTSMTQVEFEAIGLHVCNNQATGDLIYASSATQLSRLGIGSTKQFLQVQSGIPTWVSSLQLADNQDIYVQGGGNIHFGNRSGATYLNQTNLRIEPIRDAYAEDTLLDSNKLYFIGSYWSGGAAHDIVNEFFFEITGVTPYGRYVFEVPQAAPITYLGIDAGGAYLGAGDWDNALFLRFMARTTDSVLTEVARLTGAATPTFDILAGKLTGALALNTQALNAGAGLLRVNTTGASTGFAVYSTQDGAEGIYFDAYHVSASPAVNDLLLRQRAIGKNSIGGDIAYCFTDYKIENVTSTTEAGKMIWWLYAAGSPNEAARLSSTGALWTDLSVDTLTYKVAGTQVVGARVIDDRCDDTVDETWGATDAGVLDSLRDAMIAHGLLAAA